MSYFCSKIDDLAKKLNCDGIEAEKKIFSVVMAKVNGENI
jgi:hypothetical protein